MFSVNYQIHPARKGKVTEAEEGLIEYITVDPDFDKNHWVYTFYSHQPKKNGC